MIFLHKSDDLLSLQEVTIFCKTDILGLYPNILYDSGLVAMEKALDE